ncbi:MAG: MG2 domain-containing protein [bacterium]
MRTKFSVLLITAFFMFAAVSFSQTTNNGQPLDSQRKKAEKTMREGNYKDALEIYSKLALDKDNDPKLVANDMKMAVSCFANLNRIDEIDKFREEVIKAQENNWYLLFQAANSYFDYYQHYGHVIAGEFHRGGHRGGGKYVNSFERDRIRALQLMTDALGKSGNETDTNELSNFYLRFASILMGYREYNEAWRLQYLSDLSKLPDYEDGWRHDSRVMGAPVNPDGTPVYYNIPEKYEASKNDGERWRWMLARLVKINPEKTSQAITMFADFLLQQFGVQTISYDSRLFQTNYALHTLNENETIAKLASGIKRFTLPEEFQYIKLYQKIAEKFKDSYSEQALNKLAQIFENRRQYDKAVDYWKKSKELYGDNSGKQSRIDRILNNWGQFEPAGAHPAGKNAVVDYRFRNGKKVYFEAHIINVNQILKDVKSYIKSNPRQLDWNKINVGDIGYRLVNADEKKYIGEKVTEWELDLKPNEMHFDKRVTIKTPLKDAGAYLLTARMADGNITKIIIWINDTVIVNKRLNNENYFFAADAVTGEPLSKVNVEFFGYFQKYTQKGNYYDILITNFAEFTDENGQVVPGPDDLKRDYQWLITATTENGRFAYLGFSGYWYSSYYDSEYNQTKVFTITDRPVYRPNQPVKFKVWINQAQYDKDDVSAFANRDFHLKINNSKGEKVFEKNFKSDAYGGIDGEYLLPEDASLGVYNIDLNSYGGGSFRVEEYKKPEFEVNIEAPAEPVMLGEKITAKINAKYYFGAPVTKAKVKYKILRSEYSENWYPSGDWDWFYGRGYWWFSYDYNWYPGWNLWGCRRPFMWWWRKSNIPPEVVAEGEVEIGEDGTTKIEIDTILAKELHGNDTNHRYEITAEVTDQSRRTIVGTGTVLVASAPFKVYAWVDKGHYRAGDVIAANFSAQTLDNKPVKGKGKLELYKISYKNDKPVEKSVQKWNLDTNDRGVSHIQIKGSEAGQYRLSYRVTDSKKHTIEGGYIFCIRGEGFEGKEFRFNEIELIPDKREYSPGDKVKLMINTDRKGSTVVLFVRPANSIYLKPKIIRMTGKSVVEEIEITKKDMPNFFVEAFTISNGKIFSETKEIIVPPEKRVLNVEVIPSSKSYKPGEKAKIKIRLTDFFNKPFAGSTVMSVYDKSVEYISGGSNVPEIKAFFWKWRRHHYPQTSSSLDRYFYNLIPKGETGMQDIGVFGRSTADGFAEGEINQPKNIRYSVGKAKFKSLSFSMTKESEEGMPEEESKEDQTEPETEVIQPSVRKQFADTAFWTASLMTNEDGTAEVEFNMPENLTGWKIRTWAMGQGTKVGEGTAEVVTTKNLILRLQAPRFFVEKDEVVLSTNVHNYLENKKSVQAVLELDGQCLESIDKLSRTDEIPANGEKRFDWRVKVISEGKAVIRMKALTDEESDAMEMSFPVYVHGILKTDSFCGVIRREENSSKFDINVPAERRIDQSRLEVRYSPTLAGAMVDALPYLVEYQYGCTEQILNRFLPTVITQRILNKMGIDLKSVYDKQTNLNAQEIGNDKERAKQWKRWNRNPVFDKNIVNDMVKKGVNRLAEMQLSDGGWGWFSGWGEYSYPHTTAYVVHGLQTAKENQVAIVPGVLENGIRWLENYQNGELTKLKNNEEQKKPRKSSADNLDAFVYMVLVDANVRNDEMLGFLYRDRNNLAVYAKSMLGIALYKQQEKAKLDMIMQNIEQYLVQDEENQTAWLNLNNGGYWWYWYGSEYEAHAYYLKLLSYTDPLSKKASGLVKYLLNNRKNSTYWNSTRDTGLCIEAMADYLKASGEDNPDMTVQIYIDTQKMKEVKITAKDLFVFDNKLVMLGDEIKEGRRTIEIKKKGPGPLYFNAYLTNFSLEDFISKTGLEIKVERKYYKLNRADKTVKVSGSRGQAVDQKVEKYEREKLENLDMLKSGDLVEIELEIDSKNDYEYIVFEDLKAAGFEPVELRSGYGGNDMGAYMELRDERVCFFVRGLARGKHSIAYRMRAEIPGRFSALPAKAFAMYAPELKANSDEIKLKIEDVDGF